jgi:hypothetical protein
VIGTSSDKDNSYFFITTPDPKVAGSVDSRDVLELTITEECEKMTEGSIRLRDQNDVYSKILRRNQKIIVNWGYKSPGMDISALPRDFGSAGAANLLLDSFTPQIDRRGLQAIIMNPSGEADDHGQKFYNATFLCHDQSGLDESKIWLGMARGEIITKVIASLGVLPENTEIGFLDDDKQVPDAGERQDETAFRYLCRKSQEWHAIFRVAYDPAGTLCAVFLSADRLVNSRIVRQISGGSLNLRYGTGNDGNVLSYNWQNNEGENGQGDNVRLELVNGQYVYQYITVKDEQVTVYQLSMDAVNDEFKKRHPQEQAVYTQEIMDTTTFEKVKYLFRPVLQATAPNGFGYVINARMFGSPFACPPAIVTFEAGFPSPFLSAPKTYRGVQYAPRTNTFYLRKNLHTLSAAGWFSDLEIVDGYLMFGAVGLQ